MVELDNFYEHDEQIYYCMENKNDEFVLGGLILININTKELLSTEEFKYCTLVKLESEYKTYLKKLCNFE